ncbi:MAG: PEP-CTERM sorting domain-containing protein [bacterium]|nr:PEP-CTERM sorting domain-containing protein [bacterium]
MKKMKLGIFLSLIMAMFAISTASADIIKWTDWETATLYNPVTLTNGTASGTMAGVGVTYSGDLTFAQLGGGAGVGYINPGSTLPLKGYSTNFWTEPRPGTGPYNGRPYTGNPYVSNAPTPAEMIAISLSGITNTITFDRAVLNPIMTILSQGNYYSPTPTEVAYAFDMPFELLSQGRGYWGYDQNGARISLDNKTLYGEELHAAIRFNGLVTSISWVASPEEYWHGFTVGIPMVPEPGTMFLLGSLATGLFGFAGLRKRFTK